MFKKLKIFPKQLIGLSILVILFVIFGIFYYLQLKKVDYFFSEKIPTALEQIRDSSYLNSLAQFIRYYDEVLTQSSKNYGFTGDEKWKIRYDENVPKLEEKIKEALEKGDADDKRLFADVDTSNQALINMETKAQEAVKNGQKDQAIAILESQEYLEEKEIYAGALEQFVQKRGANYDDVLQTSTKTLNEAINQAHTSIRSIEVVGILIVICIIIVIIFQGFIISRSVAGPINKLQETTTEIAKGNLNKRIEIDSQDEIGKLARDFNDMVIAIKQSRGAVDEKVKQQTAELLEKEKFAEDQRKAILNVLQDVEEEKNTNAKERDKNSAILESIGDGVITVDENEKIILVNDQVENILGFLKGDLIGKNFFNVIEMTTDTGREVPASSRPIALALKNGTKNTYTDYCYKNKNNKIIPISLTTAPVRLKGKIVGAINVFRDITREKEIDKAKTEFVSLASHQLRTPLSAINWYTEMLLAGDAGKISDKQHKYLDEIYKGNKRMVELVNSLLNVSRLELGTFAIEPKPTNFIEIANSVVSELQVVIKKKRLVLKKSFPKNLPMVNADPKLARIILQNLLSNAVKYTPEKGEVEIGFAQEGEFIIIKIKDNGYGIPKNQQTQIFTKLFRADNVVSKETEGTGLGLYIVKNIVKKSGGSICFKSVENKGTTFLVELPISGMKPKKGTKGIEGSVY